MAPLRLAVLSAVLLAASAWRLNPRPTRRFRSDGYDRGYDDRVLVSRRAPWSPALEPRRKVVVVVQRPHDVVAPMMPAPAPMMMDNVQMKINALENELNALYTSNPAIPRRDDHPVPARNPRRMVGGKPYRARDELSDSLALLSVIKSVGAPAPAPAPVAPA